jgi:hypothetical protein
MTQDKPLTEAGQKVVNALRALGGEATLGQVSDRTGMPLHTVSCLSKGLPRVHRERNYRGKPRERKLYYDEPMDPAAATRPPNGIVGDLARAFGAGQPDVYFVPPSAEPVPRAPAVPTE